jgi:hypothetical protein
VRETTEWSLVYLHINFPAVVEWAGADCSWTARPRAYTFAGTGTWWASACCIGGNCRRELECGNAVLACTVDERALTQEPITNAENYLDLHQSYGAYNFLAILEIRMARVLSRPYNQGTYCL